eukprot:scaffold12954_cov105-Isochrysis_galbana.AAC.8
MVDVAVLASAEAVTDEGSGRCLTTDGSSATGGFADLAGDSSSASDGLAAGTLAPSTSSATAVAIDAKSQTNFDLDLA